MRVEVEKANCPLLMLKEKATLLLVGWVWGEKTQGVGRLRERIDEIFDERTKGQRKAMFSLPDFGMVDYDECKIPGIYSANTQNGQQFFYQLTPINHLLMATQSAEAAEGLLNRVPGLRKLTEEYHLGDESIFPIASASLTALCEIENAECFLEIPENCFLLLCLAVPCLAITWVQETVGQIKQIKEKIRNKLTKRHL